MSADCLIGSCQRQRRLAFRSIKPCIVVSFVDTSYQLDVLISCMRRRMLAVSITFNIYSHSMSTSASLVCLSVPFCGTCHYARSCFFRIQVCVRWTPLRPILVILSLGQGALSRGWAPKMVGPRDLITWIESLRQFKSYPGAAECALA